MDTTIQLPIRLRREVFVTRSLLPPAPQKKEAKVPCTFRLAPHVVTALEEMKRATGHSQTALVEHAIMLLDDALRAEAAKKRR
jgi:hypothetical protein